MITRLYVDNYKSLVNFELPLRPMTLIMGSNGAGKSSVMQVFGILRDFLRGDYRIDELLSERTLTRWDARRIQTFELDLEVGESRFVFRLVVEIDPAAGRCRVQEESLKCGGLTLFHAGVDPHGGYQAQLFRDDGTRGAVVLSDWSRSGIASLQERTFNQKLVSFRRYLVGLTTVSIDPWGMKSASEEEHERLNDTASNFASWYRHVQQVHPAAAFALFKDLSEVLPGFEELRLLPSGDVRTLQAAFRPPGANGAAASLPFRLSELSDGQRALVVLYALLYGSVGLGFSTVIDEPENFIALAEIQPWLTALMDRVEEGGRQAIMLSHHPEVINYLASDSGMLLERDGMGPTRVRPWSQVETGSVTAAEIMARGWEHEQP